MRLNSITSPLALTSRTNRGYLIAAIAGAALFSAAASQPVMAGTYNYVFGTTGTTVDWMTPSAWTLASGTASGSNYPGGDATEVDDATISFTGTTAGTGSGSVGINNITLSAPLANSLGNVTAAITDGVVTDAINLALNANLSLTGSFTLQGGTGSGSATRSGNVTATTAVGTNLSVAGTLNLKGSDGGGSANLTINGDYSAKTTSLSDENDNFTTTSTAGNVSLGNFTLIRSASTPSVTAAGLHLNGGTVTAGNFVIGSGNSSGVAVVNGANLTVSGSFIIGNNNAATTRVTNMYQLLGNVNAANSTLAIASSTFGSVGQYTLGNTTTTNSNSLSILGLQLTNTGGVGANKAIFIMSNGTLLNVGTGGIAVGNGNYTFTNNGGTIAATGSFATTANVTFNNSVTLQAADGSGNPFNMAYSGVVSGTAAVTKTGGGTLTFSGPNSYTGGTTVNAGTLVVSNTVANATVSATGTGAVNIVGGNLAGSGTILGMVTVGSGSHVAPGNNSVGTLTLGGGLSLGSGAVLDFDFNASANSLINITGGSLTASGSVGIDLFAEGTTNAFTTNGTYNLIQVTGTPSAAGYSILNGATGVTYTLGTSGHDVTVKVTGGTGATGWAVDASGSWSNPANWNGGIPSGRLAIFGNILTAPRTVTLDGSQTVTGVNLNSPFGYTIAQGSGGSLVLDNGASTAAVNDFSGPHTISAPVVLNSSTTISTTNPTDTVTVSGVISGAGNLTVSGLGTVILSNPNNLYTGTTTNGGTLQVGSGAAAGSFGTGTVANTGVLSFNSSSTQTIATVISGTGSVNQNGSGVLILSGVNTYTGTTNINSGIVRYGTTTGLAAGNINIASGAKLDVNGLAVAVAGISGSGVVDNLLAGSNSTLTFNGANPSFNGTIQNTGGNLTVVAATTGTLTLGGTNTYSGGTNVTTGKLLANSSTALSNGTVNLAGSGTQLVLGAGVIMSNPIIINNGTTTEFVDVTGTSNSATLASSVTINGTANQYRVGTSDATNTLNITGTNNAGASTTILTRGNLIFEGNGSLTSTAPIAIGRQSATSNISVTVQDNAFIRGNGITLGGLLGTSDDLFSNVTLSGNGTLDAGTGNFSLNNSNTANGGVNLTSNDNSTVRAGGFILPGTGSKNNTIWTINSGNIVASASNANFMPNSSKLTVLVAGPLTINDGGFNIAIAQTLSDFFGGSITKIGAGSLTLSGNNTYSGGTTINTGALYAVGSTALGTGGVVINSGATFGGIGAIGQSLTLNAGSHLAPGAGATLGTLTLPSGPTIPTGGTIDYNFKADGSAASLLELTTGSIAHAGATTAIDLYVAGTTTPFDTNGNYTLVQFDAGFVNPNFAVADPVAGASYAFTQSGNNLVLTITGGLTSAVWAIDASGSWNSNASWTGGIPNGAGSIATFGGVITAPRTVTLDGNETVGQINFANANAYTINQGTGGNLILDNGANAATITSTLGSHVINAPMTLNSNATASTITGTTLTLGGNIGGAGVLTTSGAGNIALGGANTFAGLTAAGTGAVIVSGASTYSGPTTITSGKIQLVAGGTLGNGLSALSIATGATLDLNGQSATVGSLSGAGTIDNVAGAGASVFTTGGLNANVSFTGIIKNTTGTVALVKTGTGNLTLSGANTFSGGVILASGGLFVTNTTGSGTGTSAVTLNGGTLGGTGTITGAVTGGSGAHSINPGSSTAASIGKLTVGSLATSANTTLAFDLATPAGTNDVLAVTGNLNLTAGGTLAVNSQTGTGATSLGYYKVLTYGTLTGSTSGIILPAVSNNIAYTLDTTHDANTIDIHRGYIGDANDSGSVDVADLQIVLNNLGTTTSSWSLGNFDGAATIDLNDLNAVLNHLGTSIPTGSAIVAEAEALVGASPAATPEPASLGLLALGAAALVTRRRKV